MQSGLTFGGIAALLGTMLVLASIPSVSVWMVVARSAASGFAHGLTIAAGVVVCDIVFILVAVLGLSVLAEAMGPWFEALKYAGAAYLIFLGVMVLRAKPPSSAPLPASMQSLWSSFLTGLVITLGDQKAILFYLGLFPAFVNLPALSYLDIGVLIVVAIVGVGAPKVVYAYLAQRARAVLTPRISRLLNLVAGGVMIGVGVLIVATAS